MIADPIYNAFATAELVWQEIDRLLAAAPAAFKAADLVITGPREESSDDHSAGRHGFHFSISGAVPRQRRPGNLLFLFDMRRDAHRTEWSFARRSLLTVAYAQYENDPWSISQLIIRSDGRFEDQETQTAFEASRRVGDPLLIWERETGAPLREHAWAFTVPLLTIHSPEALDREIVSTVVSLLRDDDAQAAFDNRQAIRWPW